MSDTLVLNASMAPLTLVPLSVIPWTDSVKLVYTDNVSVVHYYDDWVVHSAHDEWRVPSVVVTKQYFNFEKAVRFSKRNMWLRDLYTCQYCGNTFPSGELTVDHVTPKAKGGKTTWTNVVSACFPCNQKKGDRFIKPLNAPHRPDYWEMVNKIKINPIQIKQEIWHEYLDHYLA